MYNMYSISSWVVLGYILEIEVGGCCCHGNLVMPYACREHAVENTMKCIRHAHVFLSDFDCGPAPWLRNIHIFMSARGWFIVSDHWAQWQPRSSLRWEMTCRPWMVEQILALATALPASPLLAATAVRGCVVGPMQLEVRWECGVNMKSHGIPCLSRMYVLSIYCTCFFYIRVLSVLLVCHQSRFGN